MAVVVERLVDHPIVYPHMDARMGDNINGPAVVRVPDWVSRRLGRYYLYFSDHKGSYIRLAYADAVTGPWRIHSPGVLDLAQSLFEPQDPPPPPEAERPPWAKKMQGGYLYAHIASPDVHVDTKARLFRMYYHGLLHNGDQQTRLSLSSDGLNFTPLAPLLGPPYFRAFCYQGFIYTITWGGEIWRAEDWQGPFHRGPQLLPYDVKDGIGAGFRHGEVHRTGDLLHIFFTRMGDRPERIMHCTVDLEKDWMNWTASEPVTLLQPELDWEGADLPLETSVMGALSSRARELRDPCLFADTDGTLYLFYCGAGESGIGVARICGL